VYVYGNVRCRGEQRFHIHLVHDILYSLESSVTYINYVVHIRREYTEIYLDDSHPTVPISFVVSMQPLLSAYHPISSSRLPSRLSCTLAPSPSPLPSVHLSCRIMSLPSRIFWPHLIRSPIRCDQPWVNNEPALLPVPSKCRPG
jgi:hypothetical protein